MQALILGASGLVGSHLLEQLLQDGQVSSVVSIGRRKLNLDSRKLQQVIADFEKLEELSLPPGELAFCCLGTTIKKAGSQENFRRVDRGYVIAFAKAAKRAGVRKFLLVSSVGADAKSKMFYSRVKGETEDELKALGFESLVIARPSLLLGSRKESRPAEKLAMLLSPFLMPFVAGPLAAFKPVQASQVAEGLRRKAFAATASVEILSNLEIANCGAVAKAT